MDAPADPGTRGETPRPRVRRRSEVLCRPDRATDGRDCLAGRLHGVIRVARRPHRHQPPLRERRAAVQLDAPAQPAAGRLPGADARGRVVERSGVAGVRDHLGRRRHRCHHRRDRSEGDRSRAIRHHRPPCERTHCRLREGRSALQRGVVLRGPQVLRDHPARNQGRAPGLRSGRRHRRVWWRDRQLALAAPHRRLELPPGLRRQGRYARAVFQGQRALQAQALAQDRGSGYQARRSRLRGRVSGPHAAAPDLLGGQRDHRVGVSPRHPPG